VMMFDVCRDDSSEVPLPERNDPAQALVPYRTHKSLGKCVQIGTSRAPVSLNLA
jgi:hypothetical protein